MKLEPFLRLSDVSAADDVSLINKNNDFPRNFVIPSMMSFSHAFRCSKNYFSILHTIRNSFQESLMCENMITSPRFGFGAISNRITIKSSFSICPAKRWWFIRCSYRSFVHSLFLAGGLLTSRLLNTNWPIDFTFSAILFRFHSNEIKIELIWCDARAASARFESHDSHTMPIDWSMRVYTRLSPAFTFL